MIEIKKEDRDVVVSMSVGGYTFPFRFTCDGHWAADFLCARLRTEFHEAVRQARLEAYREGRRKKRPAKDWFPGTL